MEINSRIAAVKMVVLALEEVQTFEGNLPVYDDAQDPDAAPKTFLELVMQYTGDRVPIPDLIVAVDAMAPLFPSYQFPWK
ncbi:hypothetical protein [Pseudomonas fluorescens]|uniref:hypothetical protein n=1 Tax=Pseudomonas fluorescens TaxID=294 RepID=UPI0010D33EB8|nr:hypothetical protein [Pseudomonas fluorescens]TCV62749.1 hypothetical protein EDB98_11257 [Pseudomonas fluorescens]